ncbi:MAG: EamA family transporter [Burkholderiaceae bacterium]
MPTIFRLSSRIDQRFRVMAALLLVYIVWGTTYFAIDIALRDMPPLWLNASRFVTAGLLMMAWALWRGERWPTVRECLHAALAGTLMVFLAMNLIVLAQRAGIGSGLMATVVTTMPMWLALWTRLGGERVPVTSWVGLVLGCAGASVLALEGDFSTTLLGAVMAFGAPLAWSLGSFVSRKLPQPSACMAAGVQWLSGGLLCTAAAWAWESPAPMAQAGAIAWVAWGYLLVMGTLVALNAYLWLLQHTAPALAGSYSFVNPAVALLVGTVWGGEVLTGWVWAALPLMFAALALILYGRSLWSKWGSLRPGAPDGDRLTEAVAPSTRKL